MNIFVPILYGWRDFDAFGDFGDFVESVSYGSYKSCQVRGSNPCRGAMREMLELLAGKPNKMAFRPIVPAWRINPAVPQQEPEKLLASAPRLIRGVHSGAYKITHGLMHPVRYRYGRQIT